MINVKFGELFRQWSLTGIKLNTKFAELEFSPTDDQTAAWEMYVELLTRIATQPLGDEDGDEETALTSIYSLFGITRSILKEKGRTATNFTKIAVIILNQIIRPFTAKWHKKKTEHAFNNPTECLNFRTELKELQIQLIQYTKLLANMAKVEDLTEIDRSE